jgi:hypothetical protein
MSENTAVAEKDLPPAEVKFLNAPETLEAAIERIMEVEMRLEDLARASEIASITRQFEMLDSFKMAADECLLTKITIEQPTAEDFKLTVIEGEVSEETQEAIRKKHAKA